MRKLFKKLAVLALTGVMLIGNALPAQAATTLDEDGSWVVDSTVTSGQCGNTAYWNFDTSTGVLTISGVGKMWNYDIGNKPQPWDDFELSINSVDMASGITAIGSYTFIDLKVATKVNLSSKLVTIGKGSFEGLDSLTSINIPNSVTSIGDWSFNRCYNLSSITLGKNLNKVGKFAFKDIGRETSKKKVTITVNSTKLKTLKQGAFFSNKVTTTVKIKSKYYNSVKSKFEAMKADGVNFGYKVKALPKIKYKKI